MKQIHEAFQALESAIRVWWPSWILLKKLKKKKKRLFSSESRNKMRWRHADSAKTIRLHQHIVGGDLISQALVMINLYINFNVHSSYAKQVIVLKVAD